MKTIKHIAKRGDKLKNFENRNLPIILIIEGRECLLESLSKNEASVLYRDYSKDGGFPIAANLKVRNYRLKSLKLETERQFCDSSAGQNIRLNKVNIPYMGKNPRLISTEKLYQKWTIPAV